MLKTSPSKSFMAYFPFPLALQLIFPDLVEGLVLMNIDPNGKGWIDWAATKVSTKPIMPVCGSSDLGQPHSGFLSLLQLSGLTSTLPDTVLSHLFSQVRGSSGAGACRLGLSQHRQLLQAEPGWVIVSSEVASGKSFHTRGSSSAFQTTPARSGASSSVGDSHMPSPSPKSLPPVCTPSCPPMPRRSW